MDQALPPGFRFHPTDEELVVYYLRNQYTSSKPFPASSIIPEVDIYKFDPWQLPEKAEFGEKEWYFLSPRERKYPNGLRPNRATVSGYWKATGTDRAIYGESKPVGVKKSLVFYTGKPPKGIKTGWIMHEYRLVQSRRTSKASCNKHAGESMRLDDWVLCRIYKKKKENMVGKTIMEEEKQKQEFPSINDTTVTGNSYQNEQEMMMKKLISISNLHMDDNNNCYLGSSSVSSQIFRDGHYHSSFDLHQNNYGVMVDASCYVKPQIFADHNYYGEACTGNNKIQLMMKQSGGRINSNQPMFVNNQVYDL